MTHAEPHEHVGKTVKLAGRLAGNEICIEDWWDRVAGKSWMICDGNPACLFYAARSGPDVPIDNEVVYGKIGNAGHLVHVTELGEVVE